MRAWSVMLLAGLAVVAGGLVLGFLPASSDGVGCGSAFAPAYAAQLVGGCEEPLSGRRTPAVVLLAVGGVAAVGAAFAGSARPARPDVDPAV